MSRNSANADAAEYAVIVRCANKSYSSGTPVLNELDMTVPCGSIYGLLGSSGCGKTTLLSCILGQRKLDPGSGTIFTFGKKPEPGRNIGYMPQEISLYLEFSIAETLRYFGTLSGLSKEKIDSKTAFLVKLLDLPRKRTNVGTLSGGQQRRVFLAVSLIHDPKLLILDEPTVGLDPLMRKNIWLHLQNLVCSKRTTVILTTHYIEECRQADYIGIMRNGRLLIERQPNDLFAEHGTTNLEKIVLSISRKYHVSILNISEDTQAITKNNKWFRKNNSMIADDEVNHAFSTSSTTVIMPSSDMAPVIHWTADTLKESYVRIRALTTKNFMILFRNPFLLFFVILVTAVLVIITCIALGQEPIRLPLGLVNKELDYFAVCSNISRIPGACNVDSLSCHFLMNIPKESFQFKIFENELDALKATQNGSTWGYMMFPENFTEKLFERVMSGAFVDESTINASQITVRLDETSKHISGAIKKVLYEAYEQFTKTFLKNCGLDPRQVNSPLKYDQPIFGTHDTDFREFLAPGGIPGLLFFFPIITTSIRYIKEKKSGVMDRSLVGGVQTWEIMVAYSISEFFVLLIQSLINYLVLTKLLGIHILGNNLIVILMYLLGAYGGVSMGFFLGSVCTEEIHAAMIGMVAFFPNLLLSGLIWPVEGMPQILQKIAQVLPCTLSAQALRNITSRGWEFTHPNVWPGFAVLVVYIILYFTLTILFHKIFKK